MDEDDHVQQARLHIVEFRAFEKFIQGRPYWEVPVMVQRLCGICPVSHHLAACKALDQVVGCDDADAHGREDPPPDALRPDPAVARAALLPSLLARPAVRLRLRHGPPQHRRRGGRASGSREAGRAAQEVRPGSHPPHRRQAHPRHRRGAGRRQQEPDRRRARRAEERRLPDDRLEPRRGAAGAPALRAGPRHLPQLRHLRGAHAEPGARRRRDGPLPRRAARAARRRHARSSTTSTTTTTGSRSPRK